MIFATRQEARTIRRRLLTSRVTVSATASPDATEEDDSSESDEDAEDDEGTHGSKDDIHQNDDKDGNIPELASSEEILGEMKRILGIQAPCAAEVPRQSSPASARSPLQPLNLDLVNLNASAVRKQEVDNYLASTSRGLQTLLESSTFFKNLLRTEQSSVESADQTHRLTLATHLNKLVFSESFLEAQHLLGLMNEARTPRKRFTAATDVFPLEREAKQRRRPSYASR